jgi:hypothetical protein
MGADIQAVVAPVEITNESLGIFPSWPCTSAGAVAAQMTFRSAEVILSEHGQPCVGDQALAAELRELTSRAYERPF